MLMGSDNGYEHDLESQQLPPALSPGESPLGRIWSHDQIENLPLGSNVQSRVVEGFETVAYPGGVLRVREEIPGPPPDPQHQTRDEIFLPQTWGTPLIRTSGDILVPANAQNFVIVGASIDVPAGRQASLESLDLRLMDDDINSIAFSIQLARGNLMYSQSIGPPTFERWHTPLRLEEQDRLRIVVTNTLPGARFVRAGINGWVYPTHKRVN
jgi:hypothetical protein